MRRGGRPGLLLAALMGAATLTAGTVPAAKAADVRVSGPDILVDGRPFRVRGAAALSHFELLKALGADALRTYGGDGAAELAAAHRLGFKVLFGLWLEPPRRGFDYADGARVEAQLQAIEAMVRARKDDTAVLLWGIGNEIELEAPDPDPALRAVEAAARRVKAIDPARPTMAVLADVGTDKVIRLKALAPSIDVLGLNSYGEALPSLVGRARAQGWTGPIVVTELGVVGQWQVPTTPWGAPIEPTSTVKSGLLDRYLGAIEDAGAGDIAFLWGQKQEVTPTWHGLLTADGDWMQSAEVLAAHWGGSVPGDDRAPHIERLAFEGAGIGGAASAGSAAGSWDQWGSWDRGVTAHAVLAASDPDGDPLTATWTILEESRDRRTGGDAETVPPAHPEGLATGGLQGATIAGLAPGHYRLFVTVADGKGAVATGNLPFEVR
ncbi:glycoside hydrolase family 2 TIM barrel-domain containing protein [Segnochrobactrum spirostomi]|uniref:Glycosyl hydrolase n=1 Tax=Segnochrobactrum spirostomi TaxID=2608987 RepID=A0A6A7Y1B8_9HYPH|nr:glycoside hydrolase family 2 TIM barrel-domain containing protein [Segnochrobactrum spirostomi]MQT12723.1 glycosyl hydrolase [Segnochrobactrum spirostomi]